MTEAAVEPLLEINDLSISYFTRAGENSRGDRLFGQARPWRERRPRG